MSSYSKKNSNKFAQEYQVNDDDDYMNNGQDNDNHLIDHAEKPNFSQKYNQHIKTLFDKYKDPLKNKLDKKILLADLKEADMSIYCGLLIKRIIDEKKQELDERDLTKLCEFDIRKGDDFEMVFNIIDRELGNSSESIGIQELTRANEIFDLGLRQEDIRTMFRFCGTTSIDMVTMSELKEILTKEEEEDE